MRLDRKLYNFSQDIVEKLRTYSYFVAPIVAILAYLFFNKYFKLEINQEFDSNIINVSAVLSGFLFTSLGIIIALPSNRFTEHLKKVGYMDIIHRAMFIGIILLVVTLTLGLFSINHKIKILFFVAGLSETILSSYYLYKVTTLSSNSR